MLYLADKVTLFERAFAEEKRDLNLLFDSTTDGLNNDQLRMEMRKVVVATEEEYGRQVAFHINAIRSSPSLFPVPVLCPPLRVGEVGEKIFNELNVYYK